MTTFDWFQAGVDFSIVVGLAFHSHPINWIRR